MKLNIERKIVRLMWKMFAGYYMEEEMDRMVR